MVQFVLKISEEATLKKPGEHGRQADKPELSEYEPEGQLLH